MFKEIIFGFSFLPFTFVVRCMEVSKVTYSEDEKDMWIVIRASNGEFMNIHVSASVKMAWKKKGVMLNLKEK